MARKKQRTSRKPGRRRKHQGKGTNQPKGWEDYKRNNSAFEEYYRAQQILPEEEFPLFVSAMQQELPSTFRITGTRRTAPELLQFMEKFLDDNLKKLRNDGNEEQPTAKPLEWYPNNLAWQVNFTKRYIRKSISKSISRIHSFLVNESEGGNVSRQEAVSMIPPLLLDVRPGQKILDACAAPGSKTVQLIELIHNEESNGIPDGLVIANELQNKRCYMLVHQSKRLRSPCCIITNHDASLFPTLFVKGDDGEKKPLKFDRILCDVPCSGDGTLRKNPQIWKKWTPQLGLGLFRIQLRILARAVEMLAIGGRIVYSTCTLNPLEDEAVISTLLQKAEGAVELVDVSSCLPKLKRSPGLTRWKLMTKDMKIVDSCGPESQFFSKNFRTEMLAPSEEVAKTLHLERCMRIYPHQQDTGGFFIAVLEKKRSPWWENRHSDKEPKVRLLPWEDKTENVRRKGALANSLGNEKEKTGSAEKEGEPMKHLEIVNEVIDATGSQEEGARTNKMASNTQEQTMDLDSTISVSSVPTGSDDGSNTDNFAGNDVVEMGENDGENMEEEEGGEGDKCVEEKGDDDSAKPGSSTNPGSSKERDGTTSDNTEDSTTKEDNTNQPPRKKAKMDPGFKEDPFIFLEQGNKDWLLISQFYGMDESFPDTQLLVRSLEGKTRNIYLVSKAVREIMDCVDERFKVVNTGLKVISRTEADGVPCYFRLMQEGIEVLLPFISKRKIFITQKDAIILLTQDKPFLTELSSTTREQFEKIEGMGCIVYLYEPNGPYSKPDDKVGSRILFCGWKARVSTRLQVDKFQKYHYRALLGLPNKGDKGSKAPIDANNEVKEEESRETEEEIQSDKTDNEEQSGFVGDILTVEAPEGALDVGSKAPIDANNEVKEEESRETEEEIQSDKTDNEEQSGFVGDILTVEAPEGALDVGFV